MAGLAVLFAFLYWRTNTVTRSEYVRPNGAPVVVAWAHYATATALAAILENGEAALSPRVGALINDMRAEWYELDRRICAFDNEFAARAREDEGARRLATIPGIGVLNATALVAAIGDGRSFARGCDLSAWLGLVPRQQTTGGKPRLKGITNSNAVDKCRVDETGANHRCVTEFTFRPSNCNRFGRFQINMTSFL